MPETSRQKVLQHAREAERRAATFLPGSGDARHATEVAQYWRDRYRLDQRTVLAEDVPLAVRCVPDDAWFEAEVGLALEHAWDFREPPAPAVRARVESLLRERYPAATVEPRSGGSATKPVWIAHRDGAGQGRSTAAPGGVRMEVRSFPRADAEFARRVAETVRSVSGPDAASGPLLRDLAIHALRREYPAIRIVEQDPLAQEPGVTVWYVYRDGSAVPRQEQGTRQ